MPKSSKRLTTEEIWVTVLAVIGGLAVLVPLIVFALGSQGVREEGARSPDLPPLADGGKPGIEGLPGGVESVEQPRVSEQPIPASPSELRAELLAARSQIDALHDELKVAKSAAEANGRSAKRAWIQLREAAGEPALPSDSGEPVERSNPG